MNIGIEYIVGMVLREWRMSRAEFDRLYYGEQEDMIAHYLAGQQIQKWQSYRDWKRLQEGRR
jgi:hypothetical protein